MKTNADMVWVLFSAFLVFMMQAGFMSLEAGMARAKNSINVAIKNFSDFLISGCCFWIAGFALMFGSGFHGLIGTSGFFLSSTDNWTLIFFIFQVMFAGTSATIVSGAVAERIRFSGYLISTVMISLLIYPVFGHWAWGGALDPSNRGWLETIGFTDFAGSTVVHSIGAWVSLASIIVIGPRIGRFDDRGRAQKMNPHNLVFVCLGAFLLFFGWFGFNGGSTLAVNDQIGIILVNTLLSACFAGLSATAVSRLFTNAKLPEAGMIVNGVLGGLVGITAGCAFVSPIGAAVIGLSSGVIVFAADRLMERVFKLDDVVSAIPVHGFCGVWGTLAVALFIVPEKLAEKGLTRIEFLGVQSLGVLVAFVWTFSIAYAVVKILHRFGRMRVSAQDELIGLNVSQHNAHSSMLELTHSMKKIVETGTYDPSLKVKAEQGTEAGDLAQYFNLLVDSMQNRYRSEKEGIIEEKKQVEQIFGRYVSDSVRDEILSGKNKLGGEVTQATVLFCDLRNFTGISENLPPEEVLALLNSFFNEMIEPILSSGGVLDKMVGDSIMAVFGPPHGYADHADRALRTAILMNRKLIEFNRVRSFTGKPVLKMGIGINTGDVIAGNIGSSDRMEYTVIGDTVNTASRVEGITKRTPHTILISEHTAAALTEGFFPIRKVGKVRVKGRRAYFDIFTPVIDWDSASEPSADEPAMDLQFDPA